MKIEEKFNKRSADLVDVQYPTANTGSQYALGIKLTFHQLPGNADIKTIAMHLTPDDALEMAKILIVAAQRVTTK